jgi:hypothetical protein
MKPIATIAGFVLALVIYSAIVVILFAAFVLLLPVISIRQLIAKH